VELHIGAAPAAVLAVLLSASAPPPSAILTMVGNSKGKKKINQNGIFLLIVQCLDSISSNL
jgi:hypothetical protein